MFLLVDGLKRWYAIPLDVQKIGLDGWTDPDTQLTEVDE
jgi:hypothetical protein